MENNMDENRAQMEKKNENRVQMEKNIKELKISMSTILLRTLYERLYQGNYVNVEEIDIESQNHDYSLIQKGSRED
jgi:hypothetical protein